jgi:HEAT repeat protein
MKKHWQEAALVLCGLVAVCVLLASLIRPCSLAEPEYGGKRLSFWVSQLDGNNGHQARAALRAIGPEGVPFLLKAKRTESFDDRPFSYTRQQSAIALWQITQDTNLAVPALSELLGNTNIYLRRSTAISLLHIGQQTKLSPALLTRIEAATPPVPIRMMARLTPTDDEQP